MPATSLEKSTSHRPSMLCLLYGARTAGILMIIIMTAAAIANIQSRECGILAQIGTGTVRTGKGKTMLRSEGYYLTYYKSKNQIVICLPQTYETAASTSAQFVDRRTDVVETDLFVLLNIAQLIFHKGERKDDD